MNQILWPKPRLETLRRRETYAHLLGGAPHVENFDAIAQKAHLLRADNPYAREALPAVRWKQQNLDRLSPEKRETLIGRFDSGLEIKSTEET